jgi:hypothetical protein
MRETLLIIAAILTLPAFVVGFVYECACLWFFAGQEMFNAWVEELPEEVERDRK